MNKDCFIIRAYGRSELAQLYLPNILKQSAWRVFKKWLMKFPGLWARLEEMGAWSRRIFTPAEVRLIVEAIGEP